MPFLFVAKAQAIVDETNPLGREFVETDVFQGSGQDFGADDEGESGEIDLSSRLTCGPGHAVHLQPCDSPPVLTIRLDGDGNGCALADVSGVESVGFGEKDEGEIGRVGVEQRRGVRPIPTDRCQGEGVVGEEEIEDGLIVR